MESLDTVELSLGFDSSNNDNNNNNHNEMDSKHDSKQPEGCCHNVSKPNSVRRNECLIYACHERVKPKDFSLEVRAMMDVEQFVQEAELALDVPALGSLEELVSTLLARAFRVSGAPSAANTASNLSKQDATALAEARESLFVPGSATMLARTIQGACSADAGGSTKEAARRLAYDPTWVCVMSDLVSIKRKRVLVARFRRPVNMGERAHKVQLLWLVLAPARDKGTKNAFEVGRTFATMLSDAHFRQRLLDAKCEAEFRSLLVFKANSMTQTGAHSTAITIKSDDAKYMLESARQLSRSSLSELTFGTKTPKAVSALQMAAVNSATEQRSETNSSSHLFDKHPRGSKLFELIANNNNNNNNDEKRVFEFVSGAAQKSGDLSASPNNPRTGAVESLPSIKATRSSKSSCCANIAFGVGLWQDFARRLGYYVSDFRDGFVGPPKTLQKTIATTWFLYFGILLPTIAFSSLNTSQTHGQMGDLRKAIIGQAIGGLGFALFGGQPLVIIMTTAPLCLYTKVVHQMCVDYGYPFPAMYAAVGLWNGFFLIIYSLFGFSRLMRWCTRSTEEVFAMFIVVAFITDASKDLIKNFNKFYYTSACYASSAFVAPAQTAVNDTTYGASITVHAAAAIDAALATNQSTPATPHTDDLLDSVSVCKRETSLLFVLLMLGTVWLATTLYRFNKTPYLAAAKRELLADYALPLAVIAMSFVGSFVFDDIYVEKFPPIAELSFERAAVETLPLDGILLAGGLGFTLSLLFFMDQNISAAMVNAPQNGLKKGCAYHFDLLVVAVLNGFLALYSLPMMHGVLPHSPLHVRSLADIEERVEDGHLHEVITNVRETRITGIASHILILASLLLIPYPIAYIPTAVLSGLFLYMAVTSLDGLQIFERLMLLFTEQSKYPPNHYIRRCPQRKVHEFTMLQLVQLVVMCLFGFSPLNTVEMFFPVIILLMIPFRHKVVPQFIGDKYLDALDGKH